MCLEETKEILQAVLDEAHKSHVYVTDKEKYGVREKWSADLEGDCEDFALWVRNKLEEEHSIKADLVFNKTEDGVYHLVVSVDGWILDNRHDWVMSRDDLPYEWIKIGKPDGTWYEING